jgi:hypothetical protein
MQMRKAKGQDDDVMKILGEIMLFYDSGACSLLSSYFQGAMSGFERLCRAAVK